MLVFPDLGLTLAFRSSTEFSQRSLQDTKITYWTVCGKSSYGMIPSIYLDSSVDRSICVTFILRLKILATKVFFVVVLLNIFTYQQGSRYVSIDVMPILCSVKIHHVLPFPY